MCGIYCCIQRGPCCQDDGNLNSDILLLKRRGPECFKECYQMLTAAYSVHVVGCVLHFQGVSIVEQPLMDEDGSFFLWNGEVFDGLKITEKENDTVKVFVALQRCLEPSEIINELSKIHGPWAFVYWKASSKSLWFGRDIFGRRSLLWQHSNQKPFSFTLSSVASRPQADDTNHWEEVPACGVFYLNLSKDVTDSREALHLYPWYISKEHDVNPIEHITNFNSSVTANSTTETQIENQDLPCSWLKEKLKILHIGFNVTQPSSDDLKMYDDLHEKLNEMAANKQSSTLSLLSLLLESDFIQWVNKFEEVIWQAVLKRVKYHPNLCKNCKNIASKTDKCRHAKVAVLFSGGLDSTVLCLLADRCLDLEEPIDLLNVAFERHTSNQANAFEVPDRISGEAAFQELQLLSPSREWNFVKINVSKNELLKESAIHIADLVHPLETVLDNDIGCAVWFASKGCGIRNSHEDSYENYVSPARIVLTGIGADEQLAGYARHRVCFTNKKWQGLINELQMEMKRISSRNLGRDDRVISDHGREGRFPFLDEDVVSFLNEAPIWVKANLTLPRGIGDKLLLRCLACKLGLCKPAVLAKRAIQFGSRISKMENSRKGTDICSKLRVRGAPPDD